MTESTLSRGNDIKRELKYLKIALERADHFETRNIQIQGNTHLKNLLPEEVRVMNQVVKTNFTAAIQTKISKLEEEFKNL